jgi:hypothetical protein
MQKMELTNLDFQVLFIGRPELAEFNSFLRFSCLCSVLYPSEYPKHLSFDEPGNNTTSNAVAALS